MNTHIHHAYNTRHTHNIDTLYIQHTHTSYTIHAHTHTHQQHTHNTHRGPLMGYFHVHFTWYQLSKELVLGIPVGQRAGVALFCPKANQSWLSKQNPPKAIECGRILTDTSRKPPPSVWESQPPPTLCRRTLPPASLDGLAPTALLAAGRCADTRDASPSL